MIKSRTDYENAYKEVISSIAKANNVDMGVGYAMLRHMVWSKMGIVEKELQEVYAGVPDGFDWDKAVKDMRELFTNEGGLK